MKRIRNKKGRSLLMTIVVLSVILIIMPVIAVGEITAARDISKQTVAPGKIFTVTVTITASQAIYAPILDEDLPTNWTVTPLQNDGATFKESEIKWLWMESLSEGDSRTVVYNVTVPSDAECGVYYITGRISAYQIPCVDVDGESEINVPCPEECEGTNTSCGIYPDCENCTEDDGCYPYGNGCEERNFYCKSNEDGCDYTYSNRHTDYYDDFVNYCKGDEVWKRRLYHNFSCDGSSCTDHTSWVDDQLVENCSDNDGWVDTGNTSWVPDPGNDCKEKEQKEQGYMDYACSNGVCTYSVTDTQWLDTGNTRNKPDGTICGCTANNTLKTCYDGNCTDTGICNSTNCSADAACDGKKPGESCGAGRICNSTCNCVPIPPPEITFFAPPSHVNDTVCNWRTFNVTINQTANVSWYLNGTFQFTNESVREAKCTLHAAVAGEHNVTAKTSNVNGTDTQTWIWNVTGFTVERLEITSYAPDSPVSDPEGATRTFNITINQTVIVSWQINGTVVQTDKNVTAASYTNTSAVIGTWNISAIVTNANGTDMQTWTWTVTSPCFIATAAYGTPLHDNIDILRAFRDEYLMTNPGGRTLVKIYYTLSPPIANVISKDDRLRWMVREGVVEPLVHTAEKFVA